MPKVSLRDRLLKQRLSLREQECSRLSQHVQASLSAAVEFKQAECVALYSPIRNEVHTLSLFEAALEAEKQVCYPRMQGDLLEFFRVVSPDDLVPGRWGVMEPSRAKEVPLEDVGLMVIPGVGFDLQGHRLGYGRGYYDRLLEDATRRPLLCGLAYEQQVVERLPRDPHDVQLDLLVTEQTLRRFGN